MKTKSKSARVSLRVMPDLLKEIDQYAKKHGLSRSQVVARGLLALIENRSRQS
jgi:metal-responsive CopG/Arc/MetJ family transcriptional regulator